MTDPRQNIQHTIRRLVRGGYMNPAHIVAEALDQHDYTGNDTGFDQMLSHEIELLEDEQQRWPATTPYNRLMIAFGILEAQNIVCRDNFSCCSMCGTRDIQQVMADEEERLGTSVDGYAFFHQHDIELALDGKGLFFSFGPGDAGKLSCFEVGLKVAWALSATGLSVSWNGDHKKRVLVSTPWQRRWEWRNKNDTR